MKLQGSKIYNKLKISYKTSMEQDSGQSRNDNFNKQGKDENYGHKHKDNRIVVPKDKSKLRACIRCHLLKTEDQWFAEDRCENCPSLSGHMRDNITSKYENVVSILDPSKSWLRKRLRLSPKIVAGSYAAQIYQNY